ncbi:hypothetical protein KFE25_005506 [Diacronema lutheri]|uniref:Uncharacterized protein n=2 Tax=Diacronema lutheri TaxID=2081491 RepID=A0A8J6CCB9_DIALT|nr:hypothetical protein KFE25_005506 [Diacronema lutheri]
MIVPWRKHTPALVHDEELALARKIAEEAKSEEDHTRRHRIYARPSRLHAWGEVQTPRHAQPHDILMDLIMVTACFQIGHFLAHNLADLVGVFGLCAFGATAITVYSDLLAYRSRFESASLYHTMIDSLQALFFAAAAHNIVADRDVFESRHLHGFIFSTVASRLVAAARLLEVALLAESDDRGNARASARDMLARTLVETVLVGLTLTRPTVGVLFYTLLGTAALQFAWSVGPSVVGRSIPAEKRVPVHVEFTIARTGELVMLALGETVLSLVLSISHEDALLMSSHARHNESDEVWVMYDEPPRPHAPRRHGGEPPPARRLLAAPPVWKQLAPSRALSFVSAFVLISAVVYMYHHVNPMHRHRHATRRSLTRGIVWSYSHWLLVIAIISLATAIKELFRLSSERVPDGTAVLLLLSLGVCLLVLNVQLALHPGWAAYAGAKVGRVRRVGLFAVRALLCVALVALAHLIVASNGAVWLSGFVWLVTAGGVALASAFLLAAEKSGGESDRALWAHADALLAGRAPPVEEPRQVSTEVDGKARRRSLAYTFGNPSSRDSPGIDGHAAAKGCVPCGPKRSKPAAEWDGSLSAQQWQRLG